MIWQILGGLLGAVLIVYWIIDLFITIRDYPELQEQMRILVDRDREEYGFNAPYRSAREIGKLCRQMLREKRRVPK